MGREEGCVVALHDVAEHDRVRDLHHRRLEVGGEHGVGGARIGDLRREEGLEVPDAHERGIDHLVRLELGARLEHHRRAARSGHKLDAHVRGLSKVSP